MPPRTVKKATAPGPKKSTRVTRGTPKSKNQKVVAEEPSKGEEVAVSAAEVKEEVEVQGKDEVVEKAVEKALEPETEQKLEENGSEATKSKFLSYCSSNVRQLLSRYRRLEVSLKPYTFNLLHALSRFPIRKA